MSITDELRECAKALTHWWYDPVKDEYIYTTDIMPPSIDAIRLDSNIIAIADRIDAAHERLMQEQPFTVDMVPMTDERMAEHGWIRLPKDADNVPWNPGDCDEDGNVVTELRLTSDGWFVITDGEWPYRPKSRSHHHAQTVEDVLREMRAELDEVTALYVGEAIDSDERDRDEARIFAEYAAKLRLARSDAE